MAETALDNHRWRGDRPCLSKTIADVRRAAGSPSAAALFCSRDTASETSSRQAFEHIALLFQGGGALGAYQAGVYEALANATFIPTGSPASRSAPSMER